MEYQNLSWPGDDAWTNWTSSFLGLSRLYRKYMPPGSGHAAQFRVRACGARSSDGCSGWSPIQTVHTVLDAAVEKVNFFIQGTGQNAPDYTIIEMNRRVVYKRRDETGLVLAIFSRFDL